MKNKMALFIALCAVVLVSKKVFSGGVVGNGADDFLEGDNSAWFSSQNQKTVYACITESSAFPVDQTSLQTQIQNAVSEWRGYFHDKALDYVGNLAKAPNFDVVVRAQCQGDEDLNFYFDIFNSDVNAAMQAFDRPVAFAQRTSFDANAGWGKGFVWVRNTSPGTEALDWKSPYALSAVLVHELGHVFGVTHVPGTVMDARLAKYLGSRQNDSLIAQIDQTEQLVLCDDCAFHYVSNLDIATNSHLAFQDFVGKTPVGDVTTMIDRASPTANVILTFQDGTGSYPFPLTTAGLISRSTGASLFATTFNGITHTFVHTAESTLNYARSNVGSTLSVFLNFNMNFMAADAAYISSDNKRMVPLIQLNVTEQSYNQLERHPDKDAIHKK